MAPPITFVDVETTGVTASDRVVSLGILHFSDEEMLVGGVHGISASYLIFNPGRKSHPKAKAVHGYAEKVLSIQDPFSVHADAVMGFFTHGGKVVAHNASFDRSYIFNEFLFADRHHVHPLYHCTMLQHRSSYATGSSLDAILAQMGHPPRLSQHGALQDAWHVMQVYCWLHGLATMSVDELPKTPFNFRHSATSAPT